LNHEQLWAPWRLGYIQGDRGAAAEGQLNFLPGADPGCFLCRAAADTADRDNLVVERGRRSLVILNRYPYNNGHLLVACLEHRGRFDELDAEVHAEIFEMIARLISLLERSMNAEGFNVGLNLGRVAGAGVPGHLHWHVVPRWNGDTNFMPVLAGVDVIPQSLEALWDLLRDGLAKGRSASAGR
jgi:ATP adenylyltransferase